MNWNHFSASMCLLSSFHSYLPAMFRWPSTLVLSPHFYIFTQTSLPRRPFPHPTLSCFWLHEHWRKSLRTLFKRANYYRMGNGCLLIYYHPMGCDKIGNIHSKTLCVHTIIFWPKYETHHQFYATKTIAFFLKYI